MMPLISICIPSYNRALYLNELLESISRQSFVNYEVVICEDNSPQRSEISYIVENFKKFNPKIYLHYFENEQNLGYDGNIRCLIEKSNGSYCLFLGNDDLLCKNALSAISAILVKQVDCGVIVRSYATFDIDPLLIKQEFRYFPKEKIICAGTSAIATAFRRSVVIPGLVIHRESALKVSTKEYDGSLLYQLYLVGRILAKRSVIFTPEIIALRRDGNLPDFGNSEAEKGKFIPQEQTVDSSLHFMRGMMEIARDLEIKTGLQVFEKIRADIARYSYPILSIQAHHSKWVFIAYAYSLAKLGLGRNALFYCYFLALLILGPQMMDRVVWYLKSKIGYAPRLGKIG